MSRDEDLIAAYRETGCRQALDELVRRHVERVRSLVYPMVLDAWAADDVTQEVFLRAVRGLASFDGRSQFSTWLHRIALNTAYSFLDRRKRTAVESRDVLPDIPAARHEGPLETMLRSERRDEIEAALAELSPKLRAAIVLTVIQQVSVSEAARIEGCTSATMYWRVHQARKLLQARLES